MNQTLERMNTLLLERRIKPGELRRKAGISSTTYSTWYQRDSTPGSKHIASIARVLDCTTDYLLGLSDTPRPVVDSGSLSPRDRVLLEAIRKLRDDDAWSVMDYITKLEGERYATTPEGQQELADIFSDLDEEQHKSIDEEAEKHEPDPAKGEF